MKESIKSCFENADTERLNGYFEKYEGERMPEESLTRLREKVLGESVKKPAKKRGFKRLIPALAAAACLLIGLGVAYKAGAFNKPNSGVPHQPDTAQSANMGSGEAVKLEVSTNTKDKLDVRSLPEDAASIFANADRAEYYYLRFFEDGEKVYAITSEYSGIFSFDGNSFTRTGPSLSDILYFNSGAYGGYVYIPGSWYCWGNDSGLYRFELKTGKVERFVSTDETVISVAADGPNIYYSSRTGSWYSHDENAAYSLKCVNVETGEIKVLIDNASYSISDLKCANGNLYFSSYYKGVFYITPDMYLHAIVPQSVGVEIVYNHPDYGEQISRGSLSNYEVDGDTVYTLISPADEYFDAPSRTVLEAFDHSGIKLDAPTVESYGYRTAYGLKQSLYFSDFTVYDGRIVCYDDDGVHLIDFMSGEREKIMDSFWNELSDAQVYSVYALSETVWNGKLYICINDTVYEYYNGSIREYDLSKETVIKAPIKLIRYDPNGFGTAVKLLQPCELSTDIINNLSRMKETGEISEKLSDEAFDENASYMPAEPGTLWLEVYSDIYRISPDFDKIWRVDGHFGGGCGLHASTWFFDWISDAWYYYPYNYDYYIFNGEREYDGLVYVDYHHAFDGDSVAMSIKSIETMNDNENRIVLELVSAADQTTDVMLECRQDTGGIAKSCIKRVELKAGISAEVVLDFEGWMDTDYLLEITAENSRIVVEVIPHNFYYFTYYIPSKELSHERMFVGNSSLQFNIKTLDIKEAYKPDNRIVLELVSSVDQTIDIMPRTTQIGSYYRSGDKESVELKAGVSKEIELDLDGILSGLRYGIPYLLEIVSEKANTNLSIDVIP